MKQIFMIQTERVLCDERTEAEEAVDQERITQRNQMEEIRCFSLRIKTEAVG
jgi:hypothetical protein